MSEDDLFNKTVKSELSFKPVINKTPKYLTIEQIDFYNKNGYLKPLQIFTRMEVIKNREFFDQLLNEFNENEHNNAAYSINGYHVRCEEIWNIVMNPKILDCVEDLIGPDIIAWGSNYFCKMPFDRKAVPWHQDASYWPLRPARTVTVWLAIDRSDEENAAMQFIPGTHILGHLSWGKTKKLAVLSQEIPNATKYAQPVFNTLKAGEISLHADMMVHGSTANAGRCRRCGLTIRYCPPNVKITSNEDKYKGYGMHAILCRGKNLYGYWDCRPKPTKTLGT